MGGSDQWGNIVTGTELIRRKAAGNAFAITTQLIKKADGTKFGKTESGTVWLDPAKTSPYKFYQFWLNTTDADAKSWIRIFTMKTREQIEELEREHDLAPHLRILQKALAEEITIRSHSAKALETALKTSEFLFGNGSLEFINDLSDEEVLDVFDGLPQFEISIDEFSSGINLTDLLAEKTQVFPSKGEARKMVIGGGVSINKEKIADPNQVITMDNLIRGKFLVAQKGKKNYYLIIVN
jgi:tyrosyl-tRNA synthetase